MESGVSSNRKNSYSKAASASKPICRARPSTRRRTPRGQIVDGGYFDNDGAVAAIAAATALERAHRALLGTPGYAVRSLHVFVVQVLSDPDIRAAALQFCAAHPVVAAVIPGAKHTRKVMENARLMAATVPAAVWEELRHAGLIPSNAPTPK